MLYIAIDTYLERQQERIRDNRDIEFYYEGLVYVIMESEKSHNLWSASLKPRKTSGVNPFQTQRLENQRSQWYMSQSKSEGLNPEAPISKSRRWMS